MIFDNLTEFQTNNIKEKTMLQGLLNNYRKTLSKEILLYLQRLLELKECYFKTVLPNDIKKELLSQEYYKQIAVYNILNTIMQIYEKTELPLKIIIDKNNNSFKIYYIAYDKDILIFRYSQNKKMLPTSCVVEFITYQSRSDEYQETILKLQNEIYKMMLSLQPNQTDYESDFNDTFFYLNCYLFGGQNKILPILYSCKIEELEGKIIDLSSQKDTSIDTFYLDQLFTEITDSLDLSQLKYESNYDSQSQSYNMTFREPIALIKIKQKKL